MFRHIKTLMLLIVAKCGCGSGSRYRTGGVVRYSGLKGSHTLSASASLMFAGIAGHGWIELRGVEVDKFDG